MPLGLALVMFSERKKEIKKNKSSKTGNKIKFQEKLVKEKTTWRGQRMESWVCLKLTFPHFYEMLKV
ncbi:CLUMA_CG015552, isoform A [Clunio marinus]|uniref:CLUMA_CG015552, isoform A n=1 Tax=Clunio marinus TaxID=568069 RepID=A0A1J1IQW3_9DIPT|nr:CLUMA_CG015552, isoform A [Clunio marinus]